VVKWVAKTALNVARRTMRRDRSPAVSYGESTEQEPEAALDVHRAVASLPTRQQQAAILYYLLDLPVEEVASEMGCSEGTVKTHLSRAREVLRDRLVRREA
jgi:RNA polymerase sigma factor (sigma-70 family)